jgi:erythromycin esterase-like protein
VVAVAERYALTCCGGVEKHQRFCEKYYEPVDLTDSLRAQLAEARAELAKTQNALRLMGEAVEAERVEHRVQLAAERTRAQRLAKALEEIRGRDHAVECETWSGPYKGCSCPVAVAWDALYGGTETEGPRR